MLCSYANYYKTVCSIFYIPQTDPSAFPGVEYGVEQVIFIHISKRHKNTFKTHARKITTAEAGNSNNRQQTCVVYLNAVDDY